MRVIHEVGKYISIEQDGIERLRYQYPMMGETHPAAKPFFHPIRTPDGIEMTARSPIDHFWQRGLWFAFKYLNGANYWEENQAIVGRQRVQTPPEVTVDLASNTVRWTQDSAWSDPQPGGDVQRLQERRDIRCTFPDNGAICLTLTSRLTPEETVLLDRTPFTTWGGYGGLYVRMTQALQKQRLVLSGTTPEDEVITGPAAIGTRHRWAGIEGQLDSDYDSGERWGAFVFFPSPNNVRFPEPFYGDAKPFYNFFGPAPLFHEPIVLKAEETFTYTVQTLILPWRIDASAIEAQYSLWQQQENFTPLTHLKECDSHE